MGRRRVAVDVDVEPGKGGSPTRFSVLAHLPEDLAEERRAQLLEIAAKCPVHRILEGEAVFEEDLSVTPRRATDGSP